MSSLYCRISCRRLFCPLGLTKAALSNTLRRMATSAEGPKPVIGILSLGEMGAGVARLLRAHDYTVTTCTAGRSKHTVERIKAANIKALASDHDFLAESDIILSIVSVHEIKTGTR